MTPMWVWGQVEKQGCGCYSGSVGLRLGKRCGRFAILDLAMRRWVGVRGARLNKSHGVALVRRSSQAEALVVCVCVCVSNEDQMKAWPWGGFHISSAVNNQLSTPRSGPHETLLFGAL